MGAGDTGSNPGPGRSHVPWGNQACAPQLLSQRSAREATTMRRLLTGREQPLLAPVIESLCTAAKTQHSQ